MGWAASVVLVWTAACVLTCASDSEGLSVEFIADFINESDVFLGGESFSKDEAINLEKIYKWLDGFFWTEFWDNSVHRQQAYEQMEQLYEISHRMPSLAFGVGQAFYSFFWFKDNGPMVDIEAATRAAALHEIALNYANCNDSSTPVGDFLAKACPERWFYLTMLTAECGVELAASRADAPRAAELLAQANGHFDALRRLPFFSFQKWRTLYEINTNSHIFPGPVNRPVWPNKAVPIAQWLESNFHVFRAELDYILEHDLFDSLYWQGQVSFTQFSPKRLDWTPLNLIHNKEPASNACQVANRSCELLLTRPELARCGAKDVGAAFARLLPGAGIKSHFWNAPPRLGVHLGLYSAPGASMAVADKSVEWEEGRAIVFDDTYIHSVRHFGGATRYALITWICHPCDTHHAEVPADYSEGLCPI